MLNLESILNKQGQKVSRSFLDYTNLVYGEAKIGKSSLNAELFKDNGFFIFAEPRFRHLEGIKVEQVNTWAEFMQLVALFKKNKKQLLPIYPVIVISGVENLLRWAKDYTLNYFGVKGLNDVPYGQAHSFYFDIWQKYITMLSTEGYKVHFELHSTKETIRVPYKGMLPTELENAEIKYDKQSGEQYVEYEKVTPDMKSKFLNPILNTVDNILYVGLTTTEAGEEKRCVCLRDTMYWKAGITFKSNDIPEVIDLNPTILKETFERAIGEYEETEEKEVVKVKTPFEDIIKEIGEIGKDLCKNGKRDELTSIIEEFLGEGAKVSEAKEEQYEQCSLVLAKLQGLM